MVVQNPKLNSCLDILNKVCRWWLISFWRGSWYARLSQSQPVGRVRIPRLPPVNRSPSSSVHCHPLSLILPLCQKSSRYSRWTMSPRSVSPVRPRATAIVDVTNRTNVVHSTTRRATFGLSLTPRSLTSLNSLGSTRAANRCYSTKRSLARTLLRRSSVSIDTRFS